MNPAPPVRVGLAPRRLRFASLARERLPLESGAAMELAFDRRDRLMAPTDREEPRHAHRSRSRFAQETLDPLEARDYAIAVFSISASVGLGVAAVLLGNEVGKLI